MRETWTPESSDEVAAAVNDALAGGVSMEIIGRGTRRHLGRPVSADITLDLSRISGIVLYEPEELILVVAPGTPMPEVQNVLAQHGQHLPFEPPDYGRLWGRGCGKGTIGGAVMTGCNGPRRLTAGGTRDYMLGLKGVNGFGEKFVAGGRVVKNVTGFDLPKLLTGSFGTLCAATELTLKVLPAPADAATLVIFGLSDEGAITAMTCALNEVSAQVSSVAHLPADVATLSACDQISSRGESATLIRIEGFGPSVVSGLTELQSRLGSCGENCILDCYATTTLWGEVADCAFFVDSTKSVWRISVPPAFGAIVGNRLRQITDGRCFYDWAGGAIWIETDQATRAIATQIRDLLYDEIGTDGHATLIRASVDTRALIEPFQSLEPVLTRLNERVRKQFDPQRILNPGRMYEYESHHAN